MPACWDPWPVNRNAMRGADTRASTPVITDPVPPSANRCSFAPASAAEAATTREPMIEARAADVRGEAGVGELFRASIEKMLFKVRRLLLQRTLASAGKGEQANRIDGGLIGIGGGHDSIGRFLNNHVNVGPAETECAHPGTAKLAGSRPAGQLRGDLDGHAVPGNIRIWRFEIQMRRNRLVHHRGDDFDQPGYARCGLEVTDVRLHRPDAQRMARIAILAEDRLDGAHLDRIAEVRPRPMCLEVADLPRRQPCVAKRRSEQRLLRRRRSAP